MERINVFKGNHNHNAEAARMATEEQDLDGVVERICSLITRKYRTSTKVAFRAALKRLLFENREVFEDE